MPLKPVEEHYAFTRQTNIVVFYFGYKIWVSDAFTDVVIIFLIKIFIVTPYLILFNYNLDFKLCTFVLFPWKEKLFNRIKTKNEKKNLNSPLVA